MTADPRAARPSPLADRLALTVPEYNAAIATIINCRHVAEWVPGCCAPCALAAVDSIARAAIRAALTEAAKVARDDKAGAAECEACGCWNTSERIAAAIEALAGVAAAAAPNDEGA